jgi:predicted transcriptional regulator
MTDEERTVEEPTVEKLQVRYFGQAVRLAREEYGLSVSELASAAGVDEAEIVALEDGELSPPFSMMLKLADSLGTRISTLIKRAEWLDRQDAGEPAAEERERQRVIQFRVFGRSVRVIVNTSLRVHS